MKYTLVQTILFCLLTLFSSCEGQNAQGFGQVVSEIKTNPTHIFQDSQNNYWFGGGGVHKYDGKKLIHYTVKDGLCNNRIRGIQEDEAGNIYFDTGEGISKFDGNEFETLKLDRDASTTDWKMEPGDLWFEGNWNKNGAFRYDGKKLIHLKFPKHKLEDEFFRINPYATFNPYDVYKVFKDSKGHIWFGTSTFGACRFDGESLLWLSEREMTEIDKGPAPGVRSILEDKEGNFWFSSNVNHKYKVSHANSASGQEKLWYEQLRGIDTSKETDLNNYFMSITQDDQGDIWMARYDEGVWRYDQSSDQEDGGKLIHYPIKDKDTNVLIFNIYKDNLGNLWLGTHNAGVYKFNGKAFEKFKP